MSTLGHLAAVAAIAFSAGCGGARDADEATRSTSTADAPPTALRTTTLPATTVPAATSIATTSLGPTTLPATTGPSTSIAPTTTTASQTGADLRSILEPYEHAAVVESDGFWQAFEFDRCWRVLQSRRDAGDAPVDQRDVVARGDVFDCYLRTDPPADVLNDFYVIVLDDSGKAWANGRGTNGSFYLPAVPSGLLCREYLAHPDFSPSMGDYDPMDPADYSRWMDNDWAYASVLAYWFIDGQRANMDVDRNEIPCELLFNPATFARVWAGNQP